MRDSQLKVACLQHTLTVEESDRMRIPSSILASCMHLPASVMQALPQAAIAAGAAVRVLDAANNQITSLPESISQLTSLRRLVLAANQLQFLPDAVCQLSTMKVVSLQPMPLILVLDRPA